MTNPLITVITSYYNDQDFLADAISSVLAQTYTNFEYILVNHASTDKSRTIAHSFNDPRIKHIDCSINYGASGNILLQKALEIAQGTFIKLLSADDTLRVQGLEILLKIAQKEQADLVFGNVAFVNKQNEPLGKNWWETTSPQLFSANYHLQQLIHGKSTLPYGGNFIRTDALKQIQFDNVSVQVADMGLWVSLLLQNATLACTMEVVANYRIHDAQMCSSANLDIIGLRCQFEHFLFYQHFLNINPSLELLQALFPKDNIVANLTNEDKDFFPFCMAYALYHLQPKPACTLLCRFKIANTLNDYTFHQRLEKRFGFTIRNLRQDIVKHPILLCPMSYPIFEHSNGKIQQLFFHSLRKVISFCLFIIWKLHNKTAKPNNIV